MHSNEKGQFLVYSIHSLDGPECLVYGEEDIAAFGGVHALERSLEESTFWFVQRGTVEAERERGSWVFRQHAFDVLPPLRSMNKQLGRHHPAYCASALELEIYDAIVDAVETMLGTWAQVYRYMVEAYAVKKLAIPRKELRRLNSALTTGQPAGCFTKITVFRYELDNPLEPDVGTMLGEFDLTLPIVIRWSARSDKILSAEIPRTVYC